MSQPSPLRLPPDPGPEADPLGHKVLHDRLAALPAWAAAAMASPLPEWPAAARNGPFVVTGIGSSEAQARLLVHLCQRAGGPPARFVPPAAFFAGATPPDLDGATLVVISQGLSPNVRPALAAASRAAAAVLFTATTPEGAAAAGKPERAAALADWTAAGHTLFPLLPEEEYAILIRVLGPVCGTITVLRAAARLLPDGEVPAPPPDLPARLQAASGRLAGLLPALVAAGDRPWTILGGPDLVATGLNLAMKVLEGLFLPLPPLVDWLQFSHGPYQQLRAAPAPLVVLADGSALDREALSRAEPLLARAAAPLVFHKASLPFPWSLLEHEAALNGLLGGLVGPRATPQRQWPGHGEDGPLYLWSD